MDAYIVSHNGLGDNLFMIGAINFIKQFYENVFLLCKDKYYENVKLFFDTSSNVKCLPFDHKDEKRSIKKIIDDVMKDNKHNNDVFVSGPFQKSYLKSRIINKRFLQTPKIDKKYRIDLSTLNHSNYCFIDNFYKDIGLNLTYFFEYFDIPSSCDSQNLYESIKSFNIVFIQYKSSDNKTLRIDNLLNKYLDDMNTILICNDINLYPENHKYHSLADRYIMLKIVDYIDIIKNCNEIYMIDSCFTGLVLPFSKTNKLKATKVEIIERRRVNNYIL